MDSTTPINNSNDTTELEQVLERLYTEKEETDADVAEANETLRKRENLEFRILSVRNAILAFNEDFEFDDDEE